MNVEKGFEGVGDLYIGQSDITVKSYRTAPIRCLSGFYGEDFVAVSEKISTYQNRKISSVETKLSNRE